MWKKFGKLYSDNTFAYVRASHVESCCCSGINNFLTQSSILVVIPADFSNLKQWNFIIVLLRVFTFRGIILYL